MTINGIWFRVITKLPDFRKGFAERFGFILYQIKLQVHTNIKHCKLWSNKKSIGFRLLAFDLNKLLNVAFCLSYIL